MKPIQSQPPKQKRKNQMKQITLLILVTLVAVSMLQIAKYENIAHAKTEKVDGKVCISKKLLGQLIADRNKAEKKAKDALEVANKALAAAQRAINAANAAKTQSGTATQTANQANSRAQTALNVSQSVKNSLAQIKSKKGNVCYLESEWGGMKTFSCSPGYAMVGGMANHQISGNPAFVTLRLNRFHNASSTKHVWLCCCDALLP